MSQKTITRVDLSNAVYQEVGLSRHESTALVEDVLNEISKGLVREGHVKISGFGTFSVRAKKERIGRNPKTGKEVPITSRNVVIFRASHIIKDRMNDEE